MKKKFSPRISPRTELINEEIKFASFLVIDNNNKSLGIMTREQAFALANEKKMDLICINKKSKLPICKILNYDNYRFQKQKQAKRWKKMLKKVESKEIQISAGIGENDLKIKINKAHLFLAKNFKIKLTMRLKGREKYLPGYGLDKIEFFLASLQEKIITPKLPKLKNNAYNMLIEKRKNFPKNEKENENSQSTPQEN